MVRKQVVADAEAKLRGLDALKLLDVARVR
jgi:hypothetical protein